MKKIIVLLVMVSILILSGCKEASKEIDESIPDEIDLALSVEDEPTGTTPESETTQPFKGEMTPALSVEDTPIGLTPEDEKTQPSGDEITPALNL